MYAYFALQTPFLDAVAGNHGSAFKRLKRLCNRHFFHTALLRIRTSAMEHAAGRQDDGRRHIARQLKVLETLADTRNGGKQCPCVSITLSHDHCSNFQEHVIIFKANSAILSFANR